LNAVWMPRGGVNQVLQRRLCSLRPGSPPHCSSPALTRVDKDGCPFPHLSSPVLLRLHGSRRAAFGRLVSRLSSTCSSALIFTSRAAACRRVPYAGFPGRSAFLVDFTGPFVSPFFLLGPPCGHPSRDRAIPLCSQSVSPLVQRLQPLVFSPCPPSALSPFCPPLRDRFSLSSRYFNRQQPRPHLLN